MEVGGGGEGCGGGGGALQGQHSASSHATPGEGGECSTQGAAQPWLPFAVTMMPGGYVDYFA